MVILLQQKNFGLNVIYFALGMNNLKFAGGISGASLGESPGASLGESPGAHEVPYLVLLTRVPRRRWRGGGGITRGHIHSGAFIH